MVLFPPGEVLTWDFFRGVGVAKWYYTPLGKFCYGISSGGGGGGGLPYGIPSWGTFAIWYNFRGDNLPWYLFPHHGICVGETYHRGGSFTIWYCFPLGKFCHGMYYGGRLPYGIPSGGTFVIWYTFRGGGGLLGGGGENSHVTPVRPPPLINFKL